MSKFKKIMIATHPLVEEAVQVAEQITSFLQTQGVQASFDLLNSDTMKEKIRAQDVDLLITLGGDGTVLRAGHLCAPHGVPVLAIDMGRFGFLIELALKEWQAGLQKLLAGDYWLEHRMMLHTEQWRGEDCLGSWEVLNEALVSRGKIARPVHLVASLDGKPLTTYVADGLIVATPTGSTAYALAAGGPILPPELRNILIIPVAPHLSVDRAIVLPEGSEIGITIRTSHRAVLSLDGQPPIDLQDGDSIRVRASEHTVSFVRFQSSDYFYPHLFRLMDQNPSAGVL